MSERRTLASGDVLARRYRLQELISERHGSTTWRAHDQILNRNVGIEVISSRDPRAEHFLRAARESTAVTDPRFLRVLDLVENERGHHLVIREWARAFGLDQLLAQSSLPNRRAATVVAEVAEAIAHAHEHGTYHRRLTPRQVLLKQSGAVRVVGLGVATALAPVGRQDTLSDLQAYEQLDVEALGKLLYACVTSRWPGGDVDGLLAAPTEHDRLLRPRQVRAGVSRDLDQVADRILGSPPRHHATPLRKAADIGRTLRLTGEDEDVLDDQPSLAGISSPDLLRLDPVIVPGGPPPGLEPPRRRPKAYEPAPPTTFERGKERAKGAARGDRGLILLGVVGALVIMTLIGVLASRAGQHSSDAVNDSSPLRVLPIQRATDFDPQGEDGQENRADTTFAIDGLPETGWRTSTYLGSAALGGLKDGVGIVLDLGGVREVDSVRLRLSGAPTSLVIYAAPESMDKTPRSRGDLSTVATVEGAGSDASISLRSGILTRYVVIWLTSLPEVEPGSFRGEIRDVVIRGRS
ncbi:protein kinase family protein [Aeromicrobium wangtongii]|uniref:Protein kinase family protein n=1 Tax=Aeromicrobium wangtongii TaxID=2969247 RepID=A0ABY5M6D2_9ACTN|nr:protein kinase family protein [Aeromicrobium wangtongii]MCD9199368.1 protein kinase family protein [Aeromicrobium wangtongii]UUP13725.1 protein kinase family protein [Aeromicrobium wangtongii]